MFGKVSNQVIIDAFGASPCQLLTIDPRLKQIAGANAKMLACLGHSFSTLSMMDLSDVFCQNSLASIQHMMAGFDTVATSEPNVRGKLTRADASCYHVSLSLIRVLAPEPLLAVIALDSSDRSKAEQQAEKTRQTLEASIEALPHGFVLYGSDDRLVVCNEQYRQLYPKSASAMVPGASFEAILRLGLERGEYLDAIGCEEEWLTNRLQNHEAADTPVFQHLADGRRLQIIERETRDGGRVGLRIDITDHLESRERAERAEQLLLDAISALPAGFWLFDSADRLVLFNERFKEMYDRSANALIPGRTYEEILRVGLAKGQYPEAFGREEKFLREVLEQRDQGAYEMVYKLENGRWIRSLNERTSEGGIVGFRVDVTELKQRHLEMEKAAMTDSLTGLLNRRGAQDRTDEIKGGLEAGAQLAFLHIDLDRFKPINDVFGHQFGDKLLIEVAEILERNTRDIDLVARVGGDEFLICLHSVEDAREPMKLAERIRQAISEPRIIEGQSCHVAASVGVAMWHCGDGRTLSEAMQDADIALNASKDLGRNTVLMFEHAMREKSVEDAKIAEDVVRGLEAGEFTAHFQPLFDASNLAVSGFECLARWVHPSRGTLGAASFISACEVCGVVGDVDRAVLATAAQFAVELKKLGHADLRISLNLSAAQLKHPNVVEQYLWIIDGYSVTPEQFRIEILESTLLEERASHVVDNIKRFRDEGFLVDLDDFGTGHTAIASLRQFPVDRIKIDRSLVSGINVDPELEILTEAIVSLGRRLRLDVLAEGIECEEEYSVLCEMGCTCVQGFFFAHPMSSEECVDWLTLQSSNMGRRSAG